MTVLAYIVFISVAAATVTLGAWARFTNRPRPMTEADLNLHRVQRQLDVTLLRHEIKADGLRLRRELDEELKGGEN